jgi:hypothetical protein
MATDRAFQLVQRRRGALEQQSVLQIHQNFETTPTSQVDDEREAAESTQSHQPE